MSTVPIVVLMLTTSKAEAELPATRQHVREARGLTPVADVVRQIDDFFVTSH